MTITLGGIPICLFLHLTKKQDAGRQAAGRVARKARRKYLERWPSGLWHLPGKQETGNRHGGSNPPLSASINSGVVQLVERRTVNPYVTGSSPVTGAKVYLSRWACPRGRRGRTANPISESTRGFESLRPLQDEHGAIAQLGERLHGMQEVRGSTPLGSTIFEHPRRRWLHAHGRGTARNPIQRTRRLSAWYVQFAGGSVPAIW